jgi:hypothetical protein
MDLDFHLQTQDYYNHNQEEAVDYHLRDLL